MKKLYSAGTTLAISLLVAPFSLAATSQETTNFLDLYNSPPQDSGEIIESFSVKVNQTG